MADDARRAHFAHFYRLSAPESDGPICVIIGNCQAESLRVMMDGDDLTTIRMPAVHELTPDDMPYLHWWLDRASFVVSQPIQNDYHGLPVGHAQTRARAADALSVVVPVIRYAGLYPWHVIVRPPRDASVVPPLVPYHDLRTLTRAAGRELPDLTTQGVREVAAYSLEQLRSREQRHDTIVVSDVFAEPSFELMRTINHPGNPVWSAVADRVRHAFHLAPSQSDPGRPLLNGIHAPRSQVVIDAWGLQDRATAAWTVDGETVSVDEVEAVHLDWYRRNPDVVAAGLDRHREILRLLDSLVDSI